MAFPVLLQAFEKGVADINSRDVIEMMMITQVCHRCACLCLKHNAAPAPTLYVDSEAAGVHCFVDEWMLTPQ